MIRLLVTLGGGGHTTEMLRLVELLGRDYEYHYVLVREVEFARSRLPCPGTVHQVRRPRGRYDGLPVTLFNSLVTMAHIVFILLRVRPKVIIGCGPAISVLTSWLGKLGGAKVVFVETGSRVTTLSLSGRLTYPVADLFFVQWPDLTAGLPNASYAGRLQL
jgi:UDP-N-acetylglucosamine:LPS N-acetylglucosamine transferase